MGDRLSEGASLEVDGKEFSKNFLENSNLRFFGVKSEENVLGTAFNE